MVVPTASCYPAESESVYPFNEDGSREFLEDKPFITLHPHPAMGGVTERCAS